MALVAGTRLGQYEIVGLIGVGGMGEVYRASDTKLGRSVAIKVLPEAFARDADRVSRFQREAQLLAALNHSNIASIYDLQEADDSRFLIMELVEGETLAERIAGGPISTQEALKIAEQIAQALEVAHERGIVHRDLKPANVKITPNGTVKVLDFGLAKPLESENENANLSNAPTHATNAGTILGTAGYMSPEQAKGSKVDRRADIFSFGAVLFECLTGTRAFQGETAADTFAAVLRAEPDWKQLPQKTPAAIRRLLRRCLQKDPTRRPQTAVDVNIELEDAKAELAGGPVTAAGVPDRHRLLLLWCALATLIAAVLAVPAIRYIREPAPPEFRVEINPPANTDINSSFAISPDGRQIVFVASADGQRRLWLRPLTATTAQPIAGTERAVYPFWSPDSRSIGFFADSTVKRVDIGGGLPQSLTRMGGDGLGRGGSWSADGTILFGTGLNAPLSQVSASGGQAVAVTKLSAAQQDTHGFPQFLPDGRQFLFHAFQQGTTESGGIYLGSLDSPETTRLTTADSAGVYLEPGWLLFVSEGALLARRFDAARGELQGEALRVADQVVFGGITGWVALSVSATGVVAYRSGGTGRSQLTWFDRSGNRLGVLGSPDESGLFTTDLSPDGNRAAVVRTVQGNTDIWIVDSTRMTRFTFDPGTELGPVWSPDGRYIVFDSNRSGKRNLYRKSVADAENEELLLESDQNKMANQWSPDGRFLLYDTVDATTGYDLWLLPVGGDRRPSLFLKTKFLERDAQLSPDGKWMAYRSNESGIFEIYVRPFPGPGRPWQISTEGGFVPRWRADGKELYYISLEGKMMAVSIGTREGALEAGPPVPLFQTQIVGGGTPLLRKEYAVAADGRFLINTFVDEAAPITLLLNWNPQVK